jgi:hypothetical protein
LCLIILKLQEGRNKASAKEALRPLYGKIDSEQWKSNGQMQNVPAPEY